MLYMPWLMTKPTWVTKLPASIGVHQRGPLPPMTHLCSLTPMDPWGFLPPMNHSVSYESPRLPVSYESSYLRLVSWPVSWPMSRLVSRLKSRSWPNPGTMNRFIFDTCLVVRLPCFQPYLKLYLDSCPDLVSRPCLDTMPRPLSHYYISIPCLDLCLPVQA